MPGSNISIERVEQGAEHSGLWLPCAGSQQVVSKDEMPIGTDCCWLIKEVEDPNTQGPADT